MTLVRWSPAPVRDLVHIQNEVDRLFNNLSRGTGLSQGDAAFVPAVDVEETAEGFVIRADLPGVGPKDVKVSVLGDILTFQGERRAQSTTQEGGERRTERVHGTFERSFRLATPVRSDAVKAIVRDGVLEIHVPKAEEAKPREIEIQVAS